MAAEKVLAEVCRGLGWPAPSLPGPFETPRQRRASLMQPRDSRRLAGRSQVVDLYPDFGIGLRAAGYHLQNAFYRTTNAPVVRRSFDAERWQIAENFTLDYFRPEQTPLQRRGRFSALVTRAYDRGLISDDTAALYLSTEAPAFLDALPTLRGMWEIPNPTA